MFDGRRNNLRPLIKSSKSHKILNEVKHEKISPHLINSFNNDS
jgi:hypothetical protein